jgi:hypothetical protein
MWEWPINLQWKTHRGQWIEPPSVGGESVGKNRNFGLGPEASMALPLSKDFSKLMVLTFRYLWKRATRVDTKGNILAFSVTFKVR